MGIELGAEGPFTKNKKASYLINFRYSMLGLVDELLWVEAMPHYQDREARDYQGAKTGVVGVKHEHFFNPNTRIINHLALNTSRSFHDEQYQGAGTTYKFQVVYV